MIKLIRTKKRKGNILIYTLLILTLLSSIILEIRVARLNLSANVTSSKTMHNADVATQVMIDDANKKMNEEFYPTTFDYKVGDVYLQAEYTPITLDIADNMNRTYGLSAEDINVSFNTIDGVLSSVHVSYPKFGTDYINYFIVDNTERLYSNRVNSTYISKAQALKTYNSSYNASSKPLIYKTNLLSKQFSYDIAGADLRRALYTDIIENADIYNLKYPIYEKPTSKTLNNTKYTISDIDIPSNFKEIYIVFCNEDKPLPTGLFTNSYGYSTNIVSDDVRDKIRLEYSYIRIFKDMQNYYIENSLPVYEPGFQYGTTVTSNSDIKITNIKANLESSITNIPTDQYKLDTITGDTSVSAVSDSVNVVRGNISLALGNRARQIIVTDKIPSNINYSIKVPSARQYKLNYRIFNSRNILIKKREYILNMR